MPRMSIAYQCWEVGVGSAVGYKMAHGQSEGSTLRRHPHPSHETSFLMYVQPQSDLKGQSKDVSAVTTVRFSSSSSPHALSLVSEADASHKQPAASGSDVPTSSSVTTEEKLSSEGGGGGGACEVHSRRVVEGAPGAMAGGSLPTYPGAYFADRSFRVKVSSSKPGVVEHIVPVNGGFVYGSPSKTDAAEHSSESSSICQASEDSGSCSSDTGGEEAQSAYRGPLTRGAMSALDESLPIKRPGLSKFFGGKSRSFSSLAEVSSVMELAKPNNPYAKRQKMGFNCPLRDKNRSYPPPTRSSGASIAKKLPSSGSRNTLAVAVILGGLREEHKEDSAPSFENSRSLPSRSASCTDLPHAAGSPPPPRRAYTGP